MPRAPVDIHVVLAFEDLLLPVEGKVIAIFGDDQPGEESDSGDGSGDDAVFGGHLGGDDRTLGQEETFALRWHLHRPHGTANDESLEVAGHVVDFARLTRFARPSGCLSAVYLRYAPVPPNG